MSDACPRGSDLDRLLADQLRTEEEAALEAHVASCVACQRRLEELTAGERLHPTCLSTCDSDTAQTPLSHAGRYEIMDEIARGGIGVVYRAHDPTVNRKVAVKVLQERFRTNAATTSRFLEEGQITGQLDHPGIPAVHKIGTLPDGSPFLAMKLIKGVTLAARLAEPSPDRGRLIAVFLQVAQAVGYAHSKRVVHRDLKPANIMVGQFGEVQVMDWGLAKVLSNAVPPSAPEKSEAPPLHSLIETGRSSDPDTLTQVGSVLGTPAYMSPEQAGGETGLLDERADVFGLGAVLCEILTGQPPFRDTTLEGLRLRAVRGQLEDAFARLDGCGADPELIALCKRCLAPDRDFRPRNGGEVAAALSAHLAAVDERLQRAERERAAAEAKAAEEVNTRRIAEEKAAEQQKRRRAQRALLVCIGLLLFGAGTVAWWADRKAEERQADTLRRQIEDQQRAQEDAQRVAAEQQRLALNADAIRALLTQGEDALQHDDADRAAILLGQAEVRFAEGAADELRPRLDRLTADLAMLTDLDRIDDLRWTVTEDGIPSVAQLAAESAAAFRRYGIVAETTPPEAAARRVNDATIQDRLLTALDRWLRQARDKDNKTADVLLEILHSADSDPYRDAVRAATRVNDTNRLKQLGDQREALDQPPRFATVLGQHSAIQRTRREQILLVAYQRRANNLTVLMELGQIYTGAAERIGWYRAAVAARPQSVAAWNNLGFALYDKGDMDGAIAAYQQALHVSPTYLKARYNLGNALRVKGDLDCAIAAYQEVIRLNPNIVSVHNNLGDVLSLKGDLDGAEAAYREAIGLDRKHATSHYKLGTVLRAKGDADGAVKACQEATRLEPKNAKYQGGLGKALRANGDPDDSIAAYRKAIGLEPKKADHYYNLAYALQDKGDLDEAVAMFRKVVELSPDSPIYNAGLQGAEQRSKRWGKLIPRITDIAAGRAEPESPADAMALAEICRQPFQRRYVLAVRLAAKAFEADATLADNLSAAHRYHSATAAVRAADGKDVELTKVEVEEWGYFTGIALKWLRADLALLRLQAKDPKKSSEVRKTLTTWKAAPSLFVVRNRALLAAMPPTDHKAWESLWTEVDAVLGSIPSPEEPSPSRP